MDLGSRPATGVLSQANKITAGGWVVTFKSQDLPKESRFECWHGVAVGPGGYFLTYLGGVLYGVGQNGRLNEYAPNVPMLVKAGQDIELHWSIATGSAPQVTLYFRQPEVGII